MFIINGETVSKSPLPVRPDGLIHDDFAVVEKPVGCTRVVNINSPPFYFKTQKLIGAYEDRELPENFTLYLNFLNIDANKKG